MLGRVTLVALVASFLCGPAAPARAAAAGAGKPELDIVIASTMKTTPQHQQKYLAKLRQYVEAPFVGLFDSQRSASTEVPPPGAAWFRLDVRHKAIVRIGTPSFQKLRGAGVGTNITVASRHDGLIAFKLMQWTGTGYRDLEAWSVKIAGDRPIAKRIAPNDENAAFAARFRTEALMQVLPPRTDYATYERLLPTSLVRLIGTRTAILKVQNRFPWPVQALELSAFIAHMAKSTTHSYEAIGRRDGGLMPGQTIALEAPMRDTGMRDERVRSKLLKVTPKFRFVTDRGPVWLKRQLAGIKGDDAAAKQAATQAIATLGDRMTAAEADIVVSELLQLADNTTPAGEADVPEATRSIIASIGRPAVGALTGALGDLNAGKRLAAVCILRDLKAAGDDVAKQLRKLARGDRNDAVREAASKALAALETVEPK